MFKYLSFTLFLVLLCTATSSKVSSLQVDTAAHQQSKNIFKFVSGFAKATKIGIRLSKGTSGTLNFNFKAPGVDSVTLANADAKFAQIIKNTGDEALIGRYQLLKDSFDGSLNVPFINFLGYILDQNIPFKWFDAFTPATQNLKIQLSQEALRILKSFAQSQVLVSGSITGFGVSDNPVTLFGYVQFSKIDFGNGLATNIFSVKANGVKVANSAGTTVPTENGKITVKSETISK